MTTSEIGSVRKGPVTERRVLESWKAIAAYLGRTEKTCRKWERELRLPIHRLDGSAKAHVFAYADELDRWKEEKLQAEKARKAGRLSRLFGLSALSRRTKIRLIAAISLLVFAIAGLLIRQITLRKSLAGGPDVKGVAILPFEYLSPDKEHEYLCDGMVDALISALGNIKGLRVPAWTSAFYFKGKNTPLQEIGKKLKVEYVLKASVQIEGEKLRVIPQLLKVSDGYLVWSQKYDWSRGDIFAIQDEIAVAVAKNLEINLVGRDKEKIVKSSTSDREAYEFYLKGRFLWEKRLPKDLRKAIELFQQAIDRDPGYALAYAGIADCYHALGTNQMISPREAHPKGKAAALKAIEIDKNLAEAHASLATILFYFDRDFPEAEKEFKEAIRINPAYANGHHFYSAFLSCMGRHDEAIKEIFLARELDPLSPRINANVAGGLIFARRYDQALEELNKAYELFPDHYGIVIYRWHAYALLGQPEKGIDVIVDYCQKHGIDHSGAFLGLGYLYARAGNYEEARRRLNLRIEDAKKNYRSPIITAYECLALGEKDEAMKWLEKAFVEEEPRLVDLKVSPFFDPLRSDPRFKDLLRRIGLEK